MSSASGSGMTSAGRMAAGASSSINSSRAYASRGAGGGGGGSCGVRRGSLVVVICLLGAFFVPSSDGVKPPSTIEDFYWLNVGEYCIEDNQCTSNVCKGVWGGKVLGRCSESETVFYKPFPITKPFDPSLFQSDFKERYGGCCKPCPEMYFQDGQPVSAFLQLPEAKRRVLMGHLKDYKGLQAAIEVAARVLRHAKTRRRRHHQHRRVGSRSSLASGGVFSDNPEDSALPVRPPGRPLPEDQEQFLPCCRICPEQMEMPAFYEDTVVFLQEAIGEAQHRLAGHRAELRGMNRDHSFVETTLDATTTNNGKKSPKAEEEEEEEEDDARAGRPPVLPPTLLEVADKFDVNDFRGVYWDTTHKKWKARKKYVKVDEPKGGKSGIGNPGLGYKPTQCCKICPPSYEKLNAAERKYPWLMSPRNYYLGEPVHQTLFFDEEERRPARDLGLGRSSGDSGGRPGDHRRGEGGVGRLPLEQGRGPISLRPRFMNAGTSVTKTKNFGYPDGCCPVCPPIRQRIYVNKHKEGPFGIGNYLDDGPFGAWIPTKTTLDKGPGKLYYGCKADYIAYCPGVSDTTWENTNFCKCMRRTQAEKAPLIPICRDWVKANC